MRVARAHPAAAPSSAAPRVRPAPSSIPIGKEPIPCASGLWARGGAMPPVKPSFREPAPRAEGRWDDLHVAVLCIAVQKYKGEDALRNPEQDAQVGTFSCVSLSERET